MQVKVRDASLELPPPLDSSVLSCVEFVGDEPLDGGGEIGPHGVNMAALSSIPMRAFLAGMFSCCGEIVPKLCLLLPIAGAGVVAITSTIVESGLAGGECGDATALSGI